MEDRRTEEPLDERSEFCREGRYGARSQSGRAANVDAMIGRRVLSQWWRPPGPGSTSISRPSHSDLCFAPVACLLFESLVQPLLRFLVSGLLDRPQIRHATKHRCPAEARMSSPSAGLSRPAPRSLYPIQSCSQTSRQFASCSASDHLLSRRRFSTAMSTSPSTRSPVMGASGARPAA